MSKFPPLPPCADSPKNRMVSFEDCKAYGQLCRDQALSEAAMFLEAMHNKCNGSHNYYMHAAVQMLEKLK